MKSRVKNLFSYHPIVAGRPLFFAALAFLFGLLTGGKMEISCSVFFVIAFIFLLGVFLFSRRKLAGVLLLISIFFCGIGAIRCALSVDYTKVDFNNGAIIEGRVERKTQKEGYTLYRLNEVTIGEQKLTGGIFLSSQSDYQIDDYIIAQANLRIPEKADQAFGFDDFLYCRSQNVVLRGTSLSDQKTGEARDLQAFFHKIHRWFSQKIQMLFEKSALAQSLLLGANDDLEPEVAEQFEQAEIGHILSVSGVYLFFFAMLLERFLLFCHVPKKWRDGAGIILFAFFLLIFGENTAVWRIAVFYGASKIASICWKQGDDLTFLAVAFFCTILQNPAKIYDLGVQYSYAAVFSLICLMPYFEKLFARVKPKFLADSLASVFCLNIGLLPLLICRENKIWAFSLLVNLLVTLYSSLLLPLLTGFTLVYAVFGSAFSFLGIFGDALLSALEQIAGRAQIWKEAAFTIPTPSGALLLLWFVLVFLLSRKNFLSWKPKALCSAVFAFIVAIAAFLPNLPSSEIKVEFLNTEGLSAVVHAENGECALIGTSAGRSGAEYIIKNGYTPEYTICLSKDQQSMEGANWLGEAGRTGELWAIPDAARVLQERYGMLCAEIKDSVLQLSPRCSISLRYHQKHQEIEEIRIYVDGKCVCLIILSEDAPSSSEQIDVLYWEGAEHTALPLGLECNNIILRIGQWGVAPPVGYEGEKKLYNLYESGAVTAYFGKKTRLEAMYGSS